MFKINNSKQSVYEFLRSEEKKEFFKKKSNENVVVPFGTDANIRDTRRTRSHEKKNAAVAL